jgi:Flp pilus assembly protein TadD
MRQTIFAPGAQRLPGTGRTETARRRGRRVLVALGLILLAACAAPPPAPRPDALLRDDLFAPPSVPVSAEEIFALSEPMRRYLRTEIASQLKLHGSPNGLVEALYTRGQLKLEYDSTVTRNAAEAFAARSGNCLSLVVMTAAFAKELGLQVRYHSAYLEEAWSRSDDLLMRAGHVNIKLGPRLSDRANPLAQSTLVDFIPPNQLRSLPSREISEQTIVAMYMNNRAVEAMIGGRLDDAYAWVRAALEASPDHLAAYNTLGIVYARRGHAALAESSFTQVLKADAKHTQAMANLADLYARQGRTTEAAVLREQLARLEPVAPFQHFSQGLAALQRNDAKSALEHFEREMARGGYSSEVLFWLGVAQFQLGNTEQGARAMNQALTSGTLRADKSSAAAKLTRLKSERTQAP